MPPERIDLETFAALCDVAREFNEYAPPERTVTAARSPSTAKGDRPGDDFNRRATWAEILEPHGWAPERVSGDVTYWTRPGKSRGVSATTGKCRSEAGNDLLYVFTTNAPPFAGEDYFDKFGAFARLNHGGDFQAAARAVAGMGYGADDPADAARVVFGVPLAQTATPDDGVEPDYDFATNADLRRLDLSTRWVWDQWLQLGAVNLLAAEGGLGKTRFVADLCRRVHAGEPWPDNKPMVPWSGEYIAMWVAADRNHGELLTVSEKFGFGDRISYSGSKAEPLGGITLNTPGDFATLYKRAKAARPLFLVVDTVGGATSFSMSKQEEARSFFAPLSDIAARLAMCVIVITHLNASKTVLGKRAEERVRVVIRMSAADRDPVTPRRVEVIKSNAIPPTPLGMLLGDTGNTYAVPAPDGPEGGTHAPGKATVGPAKVFDWKEHLNAAIPATPPGISADGVNAKLKELNKVDNSGANHQQLGRALKWAVDQGTVVAIDKGRRNGAVTYYRIGLVLVPPPEILCARPEPEPELENSTGPTSSSGSGSGPHLSGGGPEPEPEVPPAGAGEWAPLDARSVPGIILTLATHGPRASAELADLYHCSEAELAAALSDPIALGDVVLRDGVYRVTRKGGGDEGADGR